MVDLLVLPRPAKSVHNGAGLSRNTWNILGLLKSKEWHHCHRASSWQERQSCCCQKEKEHSRLSRAPHHKQGESQGEQGPHLGKREGIRVGA